MTIDLKALREKADPKISQKELAVRIGKTQSQISRYEENPQKVPVDIMMQICTALGVDFSSVLSGLNNSEPEGVDAGKPYRELFRDVSFASKYADKVSPAVKDTRPDLLETLEGLLDEFSRKPRLMMVGTFDSGKSTIANALLGAKSLPTNYQPATKTVTFVRHKEDRPSWFAEDVLILSSGFNPLRWRERDHCMANKIAAGNTLTLKEYGTHNGTKASSEAAFALVYLDAPLLHSCEIIDLPGFENTTTDSDKARSHLTQADLVVFASPYISFMGAGDILRLSEVLRGMPHFCSNDSEAEPLANLFIVATHASMGVSDEDLENLISGACNRMQAQLRDFTIPMADGSDLELTPELLRERVFTFFYELPSRREGLENELKAVLSNFLPGFRERQAGFEICGFKTKNRDRLEAKLLQYEEAATTSQDRQKKLKEITGKQKALLGKAKTMRRAIRRRIQDKYLPESIGMAEEVYSKVCSVKYVQNMIKEAGYKSKAEAKKQAPGYIWEHIYNRISSGISRISKTFVSNEITPYIESYEEAAHALDTVLVSSSKPLPIAAFNARGAFLGGLAGLGVVGALSIWAASLGNLGAYIIAAKLGTVLAALGIGIGGGTATLTAGMAALGGPVGIAIGIVFIGAVLGIALFKSWERKLAEGIVKLLKKKDTRQALLDNIAKYWQDTERAFIAGAENLDSQWRQHTDELKAIYKKQDQLDSLIKKTKATRDFVAGIPWAGC